jgi:hypothetical protein
MKAVIFYLAKDRSFNRIIESYFEPYSFTFALWFYKNKARILAEKAVGRLCDEAQMDLVDWDYRWYIGLHRLGPEHKWYRAANRVPDGYGFTQRQWETRFRSLSELKAYRLGMMDAGYNWVLDAQRISHELRNKTLTRE